MRILKNRKVQYVLFVIYLVILCYHLFLSEMWGRRSMGMYRYNLTPLKEIARYLNNIKIIGLPWVLINVLGNIIGFIPFGMFVKAFLKGERKFLSTILLGLIFTCSIELIQLITKVGICDIDDVILNTLGVFIGGLININRSKAHKRADRDRKKR